MRTLGFYTEICDDGRGQVFEALDSLDENLRLWPPQHAKGMFLKPDGATVEVLLPDSPHTHHAFKLRQLTALFLRLFCSHSIFVV